MDNNAAHENRLLDDARNQLEDLNWITEQGTTPDKTPISSFAMNGVACARDISTIRDKTAVVVRPCQHSAIPLMARLGLNAACYASFAVYDTSAEVDLLMDRLEPAQDLFA